MIPKENQYSTEEFALAAMFMCFGAKLVAVRSSERDPKRALYVFDKNEIVDQYVLGYWERSLKVDPKNFWDSCKELKIKAHAELVPHIG